MSAPTLVRTNRLVRTTAFAYSLLPLGLYVWDRGDGAAAWTLLLLQFLAYPQLVYWRAVRSSKPTRAELDNLFLDSALLGAWVAYLGFPLWITYSLVAAAMLNATVNRGRTGAVLSLACSALGAVITAVVLGVAFTPDTTHLVSFLAGAGSLAYVCVVGFIVWKQNRRLAAVRDALRRSEDRYRLIAENADDLVAMVDHEGRWLYTSPSYGKVFEQAELADGADGFKRIHPDDAEHARMALARAASTGKPRDIGLRLVDRQGRVRQYRCRVQPVADGTPQRLLLVSHDVTDLKESEERMLLAGHALEGMTEAIMITSADGTILSVNRAFTEITGRTKDEVIGQPERSIRSGLLTPEFYDETYATVLKDGYWSGTTWSRRKNGTVYREWRSVRAIKTDVQSTNPVISHYVHVFYEVDPARTMGKREGTGAAG
ncbi:MAG TPA: PAS domain S-box protein [Burkholderiales bacterium]